MIENYEKQKLKLPILAVDQRYNLPLNMCRKLEHHHTTYKVVQIFTFVY